MQKEINRIIEESIETKQRLKEEEYTAIISQIIEVAVLCLRTGNKIILAGNGGSAADAQHLAAEFVNRFRREREPLPALALTTDTSILTSIANDYSYTDVFCKQILALGKEGDVFIAISTSGNADNLIKAVEVADKKRIKTVAFTGKGGGRLKDLVDICLVVPSADTARIQEAHITVGHIICEMVEKKIVEE
ncbi:MAG: phosphoheptose isomerase [Candidatus Omnitrophota bacterium]|nr:MAG: phosphoheptose isomerase [Candidatus Omnitrophota bacterium]